MNWRKDLIEYRRKKAAETLEDARFMVEKKRLFSAVNRIYYSLFYEVSALLLTRNFSAHRHTGVRSMFNQHFVKTGLVDVEIGKFYSKMYDFRQEGDYDDLVYFEEEEVKSWFESAEKYIVALEKCIDKIITDLEKSSK